MKIQYLSDLHLEFPKNSEYIKRNPIKKKADILIMAGDIMNAKNPNEAFLDHISKTFEKVFWVPGNHEFYGHYLPDEITYNINYRENINLVNNISETIEGNLFIFSTMWTKLDLIESFFFQQSLSDFNVIKNLTPTKYNYLHEKSMEFIASELNKENPNKIVVTHHVPTFIHRNKSHNNGLDAAFYVENFNLIYDTKPTYWVYGHNHYNINQFKIKKTKLVTNQLGYLNNGVDEKFNSNKILKL